MSFQKLTTPSAPPTRLGRASRKVFVAGLLGAAGALAGCKGATDATPPAGPTTMNTPMGNMRTGVPQTIPVETTAAPGPTTAPTPPGVMGTQSREPAIALPATLPTTVPAVPEAPAAPAVPAVPVVTTAPATPAFGATHTMMADEPYFSEPPAAGVQPTGLLKAGTKVLVVIPGEKYSQVQTAEGMTVYTVADGLKPLSDK